MSNFLDRFPRILYNNNVGGLSSYLSITNITFRVGFLREVLEDLSAYYFYTIRDGDTPEILAEKIYGTPEAYWVLLYANGIMDPFYDWPLGDRAFFRYMADKYRSQAEAEEGPGISDQAVVNWTQNIGNIHHYEKRIVRKNVTDDVTLEINLEVDATNLTSVLNSSLPIANTQSSAGRGAWEYYTGVGGDTRALEFTNSFETFENVAGKTVTVETRGVAVTLWDYELEENEKKRNIRIIKPEFYPQIAKEFNEITGRPDPVFFRRVR